MTSIETLPNDLGGSAVISVFGFAPLYGTKLSKSISKSWF